MESLSERIFRVDLTWQTGASLIPLADHLALPLRGRTHLRAVVVREPVPRSIIIVSVVEVFHLRVDEMICNERHDRCEATVSDDCDLLDVPVPLLDDLQPGEQRAQVIPSAQGCFVNQYSAQLAMLFQAGIDVAGQCCELIRCNRPLDRKSTRLN